MKPTPTDPNRQLAEVIDRDAPHERIVAVLADALSADQTNRDGTRSPDHRTRVDAAKALLAYRVGTPIQRSENLNISAEADSAICMQERLTHSPALRALFRKMLAAVDASQAIDI